MNYPQETEELIEKVKQKKLQDQQTMKEELQKQIDHAREVKYQYNLKNFMIEN